MDRVDIGLLFSTPEGHRTAQQLELAPSIASVGAIFLGGMICCMGNRFGKYIALGCGFLLGAFISSALMQHVIVRNDEWGSILSWSCFFLSGFTVCTVILTIEWMGKFIIGASAGIMFAFTFNTSVGIRIWPDHPEWMLLVFMVLFGGFGGALAVKDDSQDELAGIIATSWIGANTITWGAAYFIGDYVNGAALSKYRQSEGNGGYALPRAWWWYLSSLFLFCILGIFVQRCAAMRMKRFNRIDHSYDHEEYVTVQTPRISQQEANHVEICVPF